MIRILHTLGHSFAHAFAHTFARTLVQSLQLRQILKQSLKKRCKSAAFLTIGLTMALIPTLSMAENPQQNPQQTPQQTPEQTSQQTPQSEGTIEVDLANQEIPITTSFTGNRFTVHGATDMQGIIILTVTGGNQKYMLSEKKNILGVWMDEIIARVNKAPTYYALITSSPVNINQYQDSLNPIGIKNAYYDITPVNTDFTKQQIWEKIIRLNRIQKRYIYKPYGVKKIGKYLFNATIDFPSEIQSGVYTVDGYVDNNGQLKGFFQSSLYVGRDGITKFIYTSARDYSTLYGILSILLSLSIGFAVGWYRRRT